MSGDDPPAAGNDNDDQGSGDTGDFGTSGDDPPAAKTPEKPPSSSTSQSVAEKHKEISTGLSNTDQNINRLSPVVDFKVKTPTNGKYGDQGSGGIGDFGTSGDDPPAADNGKGGRGSSGIAAGFGWRGGDVRV